MFVERRNVKTARLNKCSRDILHIKLKTIIFQDLERIAQELDMSDEQQRSFMMKASMKKLAKATTLPRGEPRNPMKEAMKERVFQSEKGFLQNSKVRTVPTTSV